MTCDKNLDPGSSKLDPGSSWILKTGSWILLDPFWILLDPFWILDPPYRRLEWRIHVVNLQPRCAVVCPRSVLDTILNVSELVNAVSGVQKESKSCYFWDSDHFWIQILNVSVLAIVDLSRGVLGAFGAYLSGSFQISPT